MTYNELYDSIKISTGTICLDINEEPYFQDQTEMRTINISCSTDLLLDYSYNSKIQNVLSVRTIMSRETCCEIKNKLVTVLYEALQNGFLWFEKELAPELHLKISKEKHFDIIEGV